VVCAIAGKRKPKGPLSSPEASLDLQGLAFAKGRYLRKRASSHPLIDFFGYGPAPNIRSTLWTG
jgi:hypothetical protein